MNATEPGPGTARRTRRPTFDKVASTARLLVVLLALGGGVLARLALPDLDRAQGAAARWNPGLAGDVRTLTAAAAPAAPSSDAAPSRTAASGPTIVILRRPSAAPVARTRAS